jgi:hypothetical protein
VNQFHFMIVMIMELAIIMQNWLSSCKNEEKRRTDRVPTPPWASPDEKQSTGGGRVPLRLHYLLAKFAIFPMRSTVSKERHFWTSERPSRLSGEILGSSGCSIVGKIAKK